ncbi:hypothetical protein E7Z59_01175 [Robertkochia marina]|uniref:AsmA domain-containing protein n=1 Tax=Robertkochia marina TaxID=1227945 RepID=A0A4S3M1T8_9FLAO|nr:AsmA-like C-terminal region-containing protein [Robertkochia marina]THD68973.1 hypothetical protein E7Z59_01175 [Robertkochia marina]TRZ44793.1 hypothetical protein D3A96_07130 [Robertkochia marina]
MKKIFKIMAIASLALLLLVIAVPFLFKDKLADSVRRQINNRVNATVNFSDADLLLLRNFPSLSLEVDDLSIVNKAPFEGDTLLTAKRLFVDLPWKTIFSGGVDAFTVSHFEVEEAGVYLVSDEEGRVNYDIAKEDEAGSDRVEEESSSPVLSLERYELNNVNLVYKDLKENYYVKLDSVYHKGSGDLSSANSVLSTETSALFTFVSEETAYLNRNPVDWKADIEMDLDNMEFTFKDNTAHINRLPLVFEGGIAMPDEGIDMDLRFSTPSTDFTQFLSLIPEKYSGDLEGIDARGEFALAGEVKGMLTDDRIPYFDIDMKASDAYFKYADMPLAMEEITLRSKLANTTANPKDTYMQMDTLHFKLAGDRLDMHMMAEELGGNPRVDMNAVGVLNLENFSRLMPAGTLEKLQGVLKVDMRSRFDMKSVEEEAYDKINNQGSLEVRNMKFTTEYLPKEVLVENAQMKLNSKSMMLTSSSLRTGKSDLKLSGRIDDYLHALSDEGVIKGQLTMNSSHLEVADLMASEDEGIEEGDGGISAEGKSQKDTEPLLPANLDLIIAGTANEVVYDDIELSNARARMHLADQTLEIEELSSAVFGGRVKLNGKLGGATAAPDYQMNLQASEFDIASSFAHMDLLKALMPLARALEGELNGNISLSGLLSSDLTPVLNSLNGSMQGGLSVEEVKKDQIGYVQSLNNTFSLVDLTKLSGKELAGKLDFNDGKVALKPVKMSFNGMDAALSGTHQFDGRMDYTLTLQVPASYLGSDVTKLASSLNIKDLDKRTVPVDILIGGAIKQPTFTTNLDKATANFVAQLTKEQKEQLVEKGKGELSNLVNQALGTKKDSTAKEDGKNDAVKNAANDILNNLFKKKKDTTKTKQ